MSNEHEHFLFHLTAKGRLPEKNVCFFRCSLPKAMSISRSEIFRKKRPEVEKLPSVKVLESPKAISISRSEILRRKKGQK